ncbi:hypothetical protein SASPL_140558 [Salvia splendens]|uniref:ENTH domain-containing protein n=1 Tax=Salvia splendens TaxID=180675 RepID=A0A8X8WS51_SALSN|nr:hypothetical protein SASPL_140558 [Salvia splendens]
MRPVPHNHQSNRTRRLRLAREVRPRPPKPLQHFAAKLLRLRPHLRSWRVALKCLVLLHRLLLSLPDDRPLKAELLQSRTTGGLSLYPCTFRDRTSSASDDYTSFVKSYARLLDEALDAHAFISTNGDDADKLTRTIEVMPQVQSLIDRAIGCWPVGAATRSFLVRSAMKHVIRDSICWYAAEMDKVLENLIRMPYRSCVAALGIYRKAAVQAEELSRFHDWCKGMGYCGSYEYPYIDRIPAIQIRALEDLLDGMWQLTDPSSGGGDDEEMEPLIKWEDDQEIGAGWEELLEASINSSNACWGKKEIYNQWDFHTLNPFNIVVMNYGSCLDSNSNEPLQNHQLWLEP